MKVAELKFPANGENHLALQELRKRGMTWLDGTKAVHPETGLHGKRSPGMTPALVQGRGFLLPNPPACEPALRGSAGWDIPCEVKHRCAGQSPRSLLDGETGSISPGARLAGWAEGVRRWLRTSGNTEQSRWVSHPFTIGPGNAAGSVLCGDVGVSVGPRGRTRDQSQGRNSSWHVPLPELLPAAGTVRPWEQDAVLGT